MLKVLLYIINGNGAIENINYHYYYFEQLQNGRRGENYKEV